MTLALYVTGLLASEHAVSLPVVLTLAALLLAPAVDWRRMAVPAEHPGARHAEQIDPFTVDRVQ